LTAREWNLIINLEMRQAMDISRYEVRQKILAIGVVAELARVRVYQTA
jgi:hypothetical protein